MSPDVERYVKTIDKHLWRGVEAPVPEYTVCVKNKYGYSYFTHEGRVNAMNYSTAIFLINDEVRALYVKYVTEGHDRSQRYMVKTFDKNIKEGDFVVVPSSKDPKMAVCQVTDIDVDVDFDSTTVIHWVIQRVDLTSFNEVVAQEEVAIAAIRDARFIARKKQLAEELTNLNALKALPIAKPSGERNEPSPDSHAGNAAFSNRTRW